MSESKDLKSIERTEKKSLLTKFADRYSVDPQKMFDTLKLTAFKQRDGSAPSNEQMMALLVVADQYQLNPFTREIYAFPDKQNGIIPVVGVDGWSRIINSHEQYDGVDFNYSEEMETPDGANNPCHAWIECVMHRKDRKHPTIVREYLDEVYRKPFVKNGNTIPGPWQTHTKRFLRHKAMIQCSRIAFGFVGIFDQDEAERMVDINPAPTRQNERQGASTSKFITSDQADHIRDMLADNEIEESQLLALVRADSIDRIHAIRYQAALNEIEAIATAIEI